MAIAIQHLSFAYTNHPVLHDISVDVPDSSLTCVLGPNGVGKTTLFRCLLGHELRYEGTVCIGGHNISDLTIAERARELAYVPQGHAQIFDYEVRDVVLMSTTAHLNAMSMPDEQDTKFAEQALERVGLLSLAHRSFSHISGGERQLVLIARALAQHARAIVMDEPTCALDFGNTARVMATVRELADDGLAIIVSSHQPDVVYRYAEQILVLDEGRVHALGTPETVITSELMSSLYGLEVEVNSLYDDRVRACVPLRGLRHEAKKHETCTREG